MTKAGISEIDDIRVGHAQIVRVCAGWNVVWPKRQLIEISAEEASFAANSGYYSFVIVGGGATIADYRYEDYPTGRVYHVKAPGGGGAVVGIFRLDAKSIVYAVAGAVDADSSISVGGTAIAFAGKGGGAWHSGSTTYGGEGGSVSTNPNFVVSTSVKKTGNEGGYASQWGSCPAGYGGQSQIESGFGAGYGKGGDKQAGETRYTTGATAGYLRIEYLGKSIS